MKKLPSSIVILAYTGLLILWVSCSGKSSANGTAENAVNVAVNPGFEKNFSDTWEVNTLMGANGSGIVTGDAKRSGKNSVKLSKTNSFGYVQLSSKEPVRVEAGKTYTLRLWFNSANAQVTSFLIPRLVADNAAVAVANPEEALWVGYDYDSQSLMRNSPDTDSANWIKRVIIYENKTKKDQDIYLQVMLYGNPFDVYIDDFEFVEGKLIGTIRPENPAYTYSEEQVNKILSERKEESASVTGKEGVTHFYLNGKEAWPIFYRSMPRNDGQKVSQADPAGFGAQGVEINNVWMPVFQGAYSWDKHKALLMDILRKNPYAKLLIDFDMDPDDNWVKANPDDSWETKEGKKLEIERTKVSYSSVNWRKDGAEKLRMLITDMKRHGFWKIVVGGNLVGGHDAKFHTKAIGKGDTNFDRGNVRTWQAYLKDLYKNINTLNIAWGTQNAGFNSISIPDGTSEHETYPAIMAKGPLADYRQFCEASSFDLRECFARVIKQEAGKPVFVSAYGMPMENQHESFIKMAGKQGKANDMIASMSYYPYREPGFASGYHPEQSFGFHNTGFIQELDLRYTADKGWYNEVIQMWCGFQTNITAWRNMHRKLVGVSLAQNQGFWYYDMDKQFVDKDVLNEVGAVKKIADKLVTRKGVNFRPEVCLVRFGAESKYYGSSVDNVVGATVQWEYMMLETSGVPFDVHYLSDIMAEPSLQKYKVYIFHNNTFLSDTEREWITKNLKNNKRALVWMYDAGYVNEKGYSTDAMSSLSSMSVKTADGYSRSIAGITGNDKLVGGMDGYMKIPEFQGMAEALCSIFTTSGPAQTTKPFMAQFGYTVVPGTSRYQKFWIESGYDNALASYKEDGKIAMAVKRFPDWSSIYIAAPNALASEMMNNIAKEAGAYRCGPAAMGEFRMSGRFVSYHALRSGKYEFILPKGASKVIDPETGKVLSERAKTFTIDGKAQTTYWYFIE